jgi:hypothetical protein
MLWTRLCSGIDRLSIRQCVVCAAGVAALVFFLGHGVLQARSQSCEWNCEYIHCWVDGYPDPPCGDCGEWVEWTEWYDSGYGCIACGAGWCRVYQNDSGDCVECSATFVQECLTCIPWGVSPEL